MSEKVIVLDLIDLAHLMAGGEVEFPAYGILVKPASDVWAIAQRVRTRVHGGRRIGNKTPAKLEVTK